MSYCGKFVAKNIQETLKELGLDDLKVKAKLDIFRRDDGVTVGFSDPIGPIDLSGLSADSWGIRESSVSDNKDELLGETIHIYEGAIRIGRIIEAKEGIVFLDGENNSLRECLGWLIATSQGRGSVFRAYKLDEEVARIRPALLADDVSGSENDCLITKVIGGDRDVNPAEDSNDADYRDFVKAVALKQEAYSDNLIKEVIRYTLGFAIPFGPAKKMLRAAAKHNQNDRSVLKLRGGGR